MEDKNKMNAELFIHFKDGDEIKRKAKVDLTNIDYPEFNGQSLTVDQAILYLTLVSTMGFGDKLAFVSGDDEGNRHVILRAYKPEKTEDYVDPEEEWFTEEEVENGVLVG